MSTVEESEKEELSIHDILADFFLKKIDMPNTKKHIYEKKRKKSKHKSKKKKSKKHKYSSEDRESESNLAKIEVRSNSEEKDIIRLKKIKKLEIKDNVHPTVSYVANIPSVQQQIDVKHSQSTDAQVSKSLCDEKYGPSLELLLSGVKTNKQSNLKSDTISIQQDKFQIPLKNDGNNLSHLNFPCRNNDMEVLKNNYVDNEKDKVENSVKNNLNASVSEKNGSDKEKSLLPKSSPKPLFEEPVSSCIETNSSSQLSLSAHIDKNSLDVDLHLESKIHTAEIQSLDDHLSASLTLNDSINKEIQKIEKKSSSKDLRKNKRHYRSRSKSRASRSNSRSKNNFSSSSKSRNHRSTSRKRSHSYSSEEDCSFKKHSSSSQKKSHSKISRSISPKRHTKQKTSNQSCSSYSRSRRHSRSRKKKNRRSSGSSCDRSYSRSKSRDRNSKRYHHSRSKDSRSKKYSNTRSNHSRSISRSRRYSSESVDRSYTHKKKSFTRSRSSSSCSKSKRSSKKRNSSKENSSVHKSNKSKSKSRSRSKSKSSNSLKLKQHSESTEQNELLKNSNNKDNSLEKISQSNSKKSLSPLKSDKNDSAKKQKSSSHSKSKNDVEKESSSKYSRLEKRGGEKHKSKKRSRSKSRYSRSPSEPKERKRNKYKIDQAKILAIARKNVLSMIEKGTLPEGLPVENIKKEQLVSLKSGGKSVQELTDFCVKLSNEENNPLKVPTKDEKEDSEADSNFIHHPFKLKEQSVIKLNIKNAVQIPTKTHAEKVAETARLSSQFPVSSGNQHRQKELEWIPVEPTKQTSVKKVNESKVVSQQPTNTQTSLSPASPQTPNVQDITLPCDINSKPPEPVVPPTSGSHLGFYASPQATTPVSVMTPPPPPPPNLLSYPLPTFSQQQDVTSFSNLTPPTVPSQTIMSFQTSIPSEPKTPCQTTFRAKPLDISAIVTNRFKALTKLQTNPNDLEALNALNEAQQNIQEWVESQQVPGMFTGSTDAKLLSVRELCGPRHFHIKKDLFTCAAPVMEGKGMSLLKKMGWNPGEGLGKNKEGQLEPLMPDIKTDKRGLVSEGEGAKKFVAASLMKDLDGKHPVSALMELCSKRKWKPPLYTVIKDSGPPHKKQFLFKVEVNNVEYQTVTPSSSKKDAKADAAVICLQSLNVFSK